MTRKLNILLGCLIIGYIFYIRILLVRLPKDLYFVAECNIKYGLLLTTITWLGICLYILINSVKMLLGIENKEGFLSKNLIKLKDFIYNALYEVYIFPSKYMENGYDHLSAFCDKFYKLFGTKREDIFLIISYLCRSIVLLAFLYDVFFAFRLDFFYKTLILLFIPISINILFFILYDFSTNFEDLQSILILKDDGIDPLTNLPLTTFSFTTGNENLDLPYCIQEYRRCSKITGYLDVFNYLKSYYQPRVNLFIYSSYLIGWLYILIKNLYLFI